MQAGGSVTGKGDTPRPYDAAKFRLPGVSLVEDVLDACAAIEQAYADTRLMSMAEKSEYFRRIEERKAEDNARRARRFTPNHGGPDEEEGKGKGRQEGLLTEPPA